MHQIGFEYLHISVETPYLHGKPFSVLIHCCSKKMKLFPDIQKEAPVFLFVLVTSGPGTALLKTAYLSLHGPSQCFRTSVRSPLSLLKDEPSQPSQPFLRKEILQPLIHLCGSSIDFPQYVNVSLVLDCPELGRKTTFNMLNIKNYHGIKLLFLTTKTQSKNH